MWASCTIPSRLHHLACRAGTQNRLRETLPRLRKDLRFGELVEGGVHKMTCPCWGLPLQAEGVRPSFLLPTDHQGMSIVECELQTQFKIFQ